MATVSKILRIGSAGEVEEAALAQSDTIGDGIVSSVDVPHPFGTTRVAVELFYTSTGETVIIQGVQRIDINTVRFNFGYIASLDEYTYIITSTLIGN